jgi:hypothetical protein
MDPLDLQLLGFQQASLKLVHLSYRPSRSFSVVVVVVVGAYKQPFAVVAYAWPQPLPPVAAAVVVVLVVF